MTVVVFAPTESLASEWATEHGVASGGWVCPSMGFRASRFEDAAFVVVPGYEAGLSLGEADVISEGQDYYGWYRWSDD